MAKDDQQEGFEKLLSASLSRTVDFLKFAETKNAALLTFSSAWILASVNILASGKQLPAGYDWALSVAVPLFVVAALIAIVAFAPRLRLSLFDKTPDRPKNLLYFGDVSTMSLAEFKEQARTRYMPAPERSATDDYLDDLMTQVAVNSQIADRKFRLFNWGSRVVLLALAVLALPALAKFGCWVLGALR